MPPVLDAQEQVDAVLRPKTERVHFQPEERGSCRVDCPWPSPQRLRCHASPPGLLAQTSVQIESCQNVHPKIK